LTKDREERTQTARELLKKLQRVKQRIDAEAEVERSVAPERLSRAAAGASHSNVGIPSASTVEPASMASQSIAPHTGEVAVHLTNVSSAEYVVNQIKSHKKAFALAAMIVLIL